MSHVSAGGKLSKDVFLKFAKECGAQLSQVQVDVLFFIFDVDGDGALSPEEILDVVSRWEN
jgi:Ca2+-binding EF-hand superfamily protein